MFRMIQKKKKTSEFFHEQEEKRPLNNLTRNKSSREAVFLAKA